MQLFNVYPLMDLTLVKAEGPYVWNEKNEKYLDFYGGHAVISIGHNHPQWVQRLSHQLSDGISFFSNSVKLPIQAELAQKLGEVSGYEDYSLFLVNSGAEANENAIKLASFHTQKKKIISFGGAFHGRTSAAVAATDNPKIKAAVNSDEHVIFLPLNDKEALDKAFAENEIACVIIEPVQGVNGIYEATPEFLQYISEITQKNHAVFIADEVQCGYGRTGKFFAHQWSDVRPDIITTAKGMGNGFPVGGVLIAPHFESWFGMLGTTFGGAPLACAASLAVLEVIESDNLLDNSIAMGNYLIDQLKDLEDVVEIRGSGLMIGLEMKYPIKDLRTRMMQEYKILTGSSSQPNTIRLLPALNITKTEADEVITAFRALCK